MNILLFTESLTSGGAERQIVELAKGLKASGDIVEVCFYRPYYHYRKELIKHGISIREFNKYGKFDLGFLWDLRNYIKHRKPDFIISYKTIPNIYILLASMLAAYKNIIISERNTDLETKRHEIILEKLLSKNARYVVTNSHTMANLLAKNMNFTAKQIRVIHNGIDVSAFTDIDKTELAAIKRDLGIDSRNFNICLVGRIARQKNHDLLIDAMHLLVNKQKMPHRTVKAYFIGDIGDQALYDRLTCKIDSLGLGDNIVFREAMDNIKYVYSAMDAVILPSLYEGFPNVVLEAMCCAKIVLASDVSDNKYIIQDGINGFLFENNNLPMLVEKLLRIGNMPEEEKELIGNRAAESISKNFSSQNMVEKYRLLING